MFNIFKKNKEYISCKWLESGIHFAPSGLYYCDKYAHIGGNSYPVTKLKMNYRYDFENFAKQRKKDLELVRKGIILDRCQGCFLMEKKNWNKDRKIRCIAISTNISCNSCCIYCYTSKYKRLYNKVPDIPILDFMKKLISKKRIDSDCEIQIGGGEPTINHEFEDLMKLFEKYSFNNIRIYSSGIKYSSAIERCLEKDMLQELVISPDSGNRDLYLKIKNVDKFDEVWSNIKNYALKQNTKKDSLTIKYIIIPSINDNKENIKEFVDLANESFVKRIIVDIEMEWYRQNCTNQEEIIKILELVKYMKDVIIKEDISFVPGSSVCCAINDNSDNYAGII